MNDNEPSVFEVGDRLVAWFDRHITITARLQGLQEWLATTVQSFDAGAPAIEIPVERLADLAAVVAITDLVPVEVPDAARAFVRGLCMPDMPLAAIVGIEDSADVALRGLRRVVQDVLQHAGQLDDLQGMMMVVVEPMHCPSGWGVNAANDCAVSTNLWETAWLLHQVQAEKPGEHVFLATVGPALTAREYLVFHANRVAETVAERLGYATTISRASGEFDRIVETVQDTLRDTWLPIVLGSEGQMDAMGAPRDG